MPKDKGYITQLFSLCLFQVHFASHKGQNNNDTKKEKNVTAAAGELWLDSVVEALGTCTCNDDKLKHLKLEIE